MIVNALLQDCEIQPPSKYLFITSYTICFDMAYECEFRSRHTQNKCHYSIIKCYIRLSSRYKTFLDIISHDNLKSSSSLRTNMYLQESTPLACMFIPLAWLRR